MDGARCILHLDMDAFYAAVEQRDRPEWRGKPVIVGADPRGGLGRGVVSTASYEARSFGVRSAMPIGQAWRACPHGIYVRPDMRKYAEVSRQVMAILQRFTELVQQLSIDEAFLDVTHSQRAFGAGEKIAGALKRSVHEETGLTASVGMATCKLLAKVASDMRKPDGLVVVPVGQEAAFLAPLPVRRLWGVGPKLEDTLVRAGLHTIGDLAACDPAVLERRWGTHGHDLVLLARGIDPRPVSALPEAARSIGHEHTYDEDTDDRQRLRNTLLTLADAVARRLREQELPARTITLKYRDEGFHTQTRAATLTEATMSGDTIFKAAWAAFERVHGRRKVRLLGIYASGLGPERQLELWQPPASPLDQVRDLVAARFGAKALTRASLLERSQQAARRTAGSDKK